MKKQGLYIHNDDEFISSVQSGKQVLNLLASGAGVEIMRQDIKKDVSFDVFPVDDGRSFLEFFYIIDGVLEYIPQGEEKRKILKPKDYFYVSDLESVCLFRTLTNVSMMYITTEPVFDDIEASVNEMSKIRKDVKDKDEYTFEHSERVKELAVKTAIHMGLDAKKVANIAIASLSHDVGKIEIPDAILQKPESLSDEEYLLVQDHAGVSKELLKGIKNSDISEIVSQHHELWDGSGYPNGLKQDEIRIEARVITVADSFDAMTSKRVYNVPKSKREAMIELQQFSGKLYDPQVIASFIAILDE